MKRYVIAAAAVACLGTATQAKDAPMNNSAIANYFSGKQFVLGGGVASFAADKTYVFSGLFRGKWRVTNRSMCITFDAGGTRCDKVVRDGKNVFLIDAGGGRTPVR